MKRSTTDVKRSTTDVKRSTTDVKRSTTDVKRSTTEDTEDAEKRFCAETGFALRVLCVLRGAEVVL